MMTLLQPDTIFEPSGVLYEQSLLGNVDRERLPITTTAVRLSLKTVFINKLHELGRGEILVVSVVTDGVSKEPIVLQAEVYEQIKRKTFLPIGPTGLTLYRTDTDGAIPPYLDYRILVLEVDQNIRDVGELLDEVRQDQQFNSFKNSLLAVTTFTAPQIALIGTATDLALNLVAKVFKGKKDRQLYLLQGSFDNAFDDLGVGLGVITQGNNDVTITYQVEAV